ncbi:MAG: hypothetical protein KJ888_20465 [Gammaproteobacteria bacterium]|uniref:Uncharacterized protein n=1 Tax=viral metagenome TaxID=1070528 RepID=A0A6M3IFS4_9ZZZZ|nr:hypothetical protein [Gammaproteobacteria bacterium]
MRSLKTQDKVTSALLHIQALRKKILVAEAVIKTATLEMDQPMAILEAWLRNKDESDTKTDRDKN